MPLTVCYASETGTAEDVAFKIVSRSEMLGLEVEICSIDEYNVETLPTEQMIVFVCSTTGDGEVPSSMRQFWKFLLRCGNSYSVNNVLSLIHRFFPGRVSLETL